MFRVFLDSADGIPLVPSFRGGWLERPTPITVPASRPEIGLYAVHPVVERRRLRRLHAKRGSAFNTFNVTWQLVTFSDRR